MSRSWCKSSWISFRCRSSAPMRTDNASTANEIEKARNGKSVRALIREPYVACSPLCIYRTSKGTNQDGHFHDHNQMDLWPLCPGAIRAGNGRTSGIRFRDFEHRCERKIFLSHEVEADKALASSDFFPRGPLVRRSDSSANAAPLFC